MTGKKFNSVIDGLLAFVNCFEKFEAFIASVLDNDNKILFMISEYEKRTKELDRLAKRLEKRMKDYKKSAKTNPNICFLTSNALKRQIKNVEAYVVVAKNLFEEFAEIPINTNDKELIARYETAKSFLLSNTCKTFTQLSDSFVLELVT